MKKKMDSTSLHGVQAQPGNSNVIEMRARLFISIRNLELAISWTPVKTHSFAKDSFRMRTQISKIWSIHTFTYSQHSNHYIEKDRREQIEKIR